MEKAPEITVGKIFNFLYHNADCKFHVDYQGSHGTLFNVGHISIYMSDGVVTAHNDLTGYFEVIQNMAGLSYFFLTRRGKQQ